MSEATRRHGTGGSPDGVTLLFFGPHGTRTVELGPGQSVTVGRDGPCDVQLRSDGVSRRHATFSLERSGLSVVDLGSTNGTKVRGRAVERAALEPGDVVMLGEVSVTVVERGAHEPLPRGVEGWERFSQRLADEGVRARELHRPFCLLEVKAQVRGVHVSRFLPAVLERLRAVDAVAQFSAHRLMVLLPETERGGAEKLAASLLDLAEPRLGVALAAWPHDGVSAEQLVAAVGRGVLELSRSHSLAHATGEDPARPLVKDPAMLALFETARRIAASPLNVLVLGETGTGKEVLARELHRASPRARRPFVAINCAAIAPGLLESTLFGHERGAFTGAERRAAGVFEQADGGTLFLDEVGELSPGAQAALLRVLETRRLTRVGGELEVPVDVRVVSATHRDLEGAGFRADLKFRLDGVSLRIPALRERPLDIPAFAQRFFDEARSAHRRSVKRLKPDALAALSRYGWPGNVRELKNVIERAVVIADGDEVTAADLGERLTEPKVVVAAPAAASSAENVSFKEQVRRQVDALETSLIIAALERSKGNQTQAAKALGLPLRTLVHKMRALGIKKRFA